MSRTCCVTKSSDIGRAATEAKSLCRSTATARRWQDSRASRTFPGRYFLGIPPRPIWTSSTTSTKSPAWVSDGLKRRTDSEERQGIASAADARLLSLIYACSKNKDLVGGTRLHAELQKRGLAGKNYSDALITMYAKCGEIQRAQTLLDMHNSSRIIPWTALIEGYARQGKGQNAFNCFQQMQYEGICADAVTYASLLKACGAIRAIDKGRQIHDEVSRRGLLEHDLVLGGALVDMYVKCGALTQAQIVLESLPSLNVILWSALIAGYAEKGQGKEALECYKLMQRDNIPPNAVTYACILKACAVMGDNVKGKEIHDEISRLGLLERDSILGGALVDMYVKCGALPQAQSVLEKLPSANAILWSALIAGYAQTGQGQEALDCFGKMQHKGIHPDAVTYASIVRACAVIGDINRGKQVHEEILREGLLEDNIVLGGALVHFYAKCGVLLQARSILEKLPSRNAILWSALIVGYAQCGQGEQALECFDRMLGESITPDPVTYLCILNVCATLGAIDKGKQIHDEVSRQGLLEHDLVLGNALVDMYAKCGDLQQAQNVLEKLPSRDVVSWNSLIAGYARKGQGEQAFESIGQMQHEDILPDVVTFICLLHLCSRQGLVEKGQDLFDNMGTMHNVWPNMACFKCMVHFLGRCGHLIKAVEVIRQMRCSANPTIWLCLLVGCQKWADVNVGIWALQQARELDKCIGQRAL
ncbi:hypothetical protein GOP47_0004493 [Adiantum capillus-veneris]|uniref:Pentatricopeptide repeat-containing protein n=1 Tax=Adiantum capillus-veneris TaxID=13818 RepID=A0A9D4ZQD9_ADICA|nr:hypothetical protein GOP47_0004493 [Adiantum capillus-veneris]